MGAADRAGARESSLESEKLLRGRSNLGWRPAPMPPERRDVSTATPTGRGRYGAARGRNSGQSCDEEM